MADARALVSQLLNSSLWAWYNLRKGMAGNSSAAQICSADNLGPLGRNPTCSPLHIWPEALLRDQDNVLVGGFLWRRFGRNLSTQNPKVVDEVPHLRLGHAPFLAWHRFLAGGHDGKKFAVGPLGQRVRLCEIRQLQFHLFGQVAFPVSLFSVAHRALSFEYLLASIYGRIGKPARIFLGCVFGRYYVVVR